MLLWNRNIFVGIKKDVMLGRSLSHGGEKAILLKWRPWKELCVARNEASEKSIGTSTVFFSLLNKELAKTHQKSACSVVLV